MVGRKSASSCSTTSPGRANGQVRGSAVSTPPNRRTAPWHRSRRTTTYVVTAGICVFWSGPALPALGQGRGTGRKEACPIRIAALGIDRGYELPQRRLHRNSVRADEERRPGQPGSTGRKEGQAMQDFRTAVREAVRDEAALRG